MKKIIIPVLLFCSFLLAGCTGKILTNTSNQTSSIPNTSTTTTINTTVAPTTTTTISSTKTSAVSSTTVQNPTFNDYGYDVITVNLSKYTVSYTGLYTSKEEVGAYIYTYKKLPSNFKRKSDFNRSDYTPQNKLSTGGDTFYNKEGRLPSASGRTYTECDIDYSGGSRGSKRIVFSSDFLIFYTADHYDSFDMMHFIG